MKIFPVTLFVLKIYPVYLFVLKILPFPMICLLILKGSSKMFKFPLNFSIADSSEFITYKYSLGVVLLCNTNTLAHSKMCLKCKKKGKRFNCSP